MKNGCGLILAVFLGLLLLMGVVFGESYMIWASLGAIVLYIFISVKVAQSKKLATTGGWPDISISSSKANARQYRKLWLTYPDKYCVLDTETTGLDETDEIIDIAIIDMEGNVLLDTLVKPVGIIPEASTRIHGITASMVKDSPGWADISGMVRNAIGDREVIVFNAAYDIKLIRQTDKICSMTTTPFTAQCLMRNLHVSIGVEKKWPRLAEMAEYYEIDTPKSHRALADCQTTLAVLKASV